MRLLGQESTIWAARPGRGVEKETPGKFAKTSPQKVGRENPVCRQSHPPVQAGCFNLAVVIRAFEPYLNPRPSAQNIAGCDIYSLLERRVDQGAPRGAGCSLSEAKGWDVSHIRFPYIGARRQGWRPRSARLEHSHAFFGMAAVSEKIASDCARPAAAFPLDAPRRRSVTWRSGSRHFTVHYGQRATSCAAAWMRPSTRITSWCCCS